MNDAQKILNSYNYSLKLREQLISPTSNTNSPLKPSILAQISPKKNSKSCNHSRQVTLSEFDVAYQGTLLTSGNCPQILEVKEQKSKYYLKLLLIFPRKP